MALSSDGYLYSWGSNINGQNGNGTTSTGTIYTPVRVVTGAQGDAGGYLTGVTEIVMGISSSLALSSDGYLYAWGMNNVGQLGDGTSSHRISPVKVSRPR